MHTLELKFENESAKEAMSHFIITNSKQAFVETSISPNSVERVGDAVFFTKQPEEPAEAPVFQVEEFEEISGVGESLGADDTGNPTSTYAIVEADGGSVKSPTTKSEDEDTSEDE